MSPYELVQSEKAEFPVGVLCEAVGVSRSAFYAWRRGTPSQRKLANDRVLTEIRAIHVEHRARYGSPRMLDELRDRGHEVGKHRVARLMRENGLRARIRRRFRRTTDSGHKHPVAPNLLARQFTTAAPNQAWVGDITYIWTAEGWAYLAVLLDLYSRRVVGWALRKSLSRDLAVATLQHALVARRPPPGLVHHTDRGCQYASGDYRRLLDKHGAACSMSAAGECWDMPSSPRTKPSGLRNPGRSVRSRPRGRKINVRAHPSLALARRGPMATKKAQSAGTKDSPWQLKTPPGSAEFEAYRDPEAEPPALVVQVGKTQLRYHLRAIEDLVAMLEKHGDWMPLGGTDEQKPAAEGTVEAWARSTKNPVKGWYGLKKGLRGRFAVYVPPVLEALGLAELEHLPKYNRVRVVTRRK